MLNLTTLRVFWRPPPLEGINGILKGFQIHIHSNSSTGGRSRNVTTNARATNVTLFNLAAGTAYQVQVAARTAAGVGVFYSSDIIVMDEATLHDHLQLLNEADGSLFWAFLGHPLVVAVAFLIICGAPFALLVLVICRWWRHRGNKANCRYGPFMKVNDASLMYTARDAFWRDHQMFANDASHAAAHESRHGSEHCYERSPIPIACRNGACDGPYSGTMSSESPHHYHYAQLPDPRTNSMDSFYVRPEFEEDLSPYAATPLVMNSQGGLFIDMNTTERRRPWPPQGSGPVLPLTPVPAGPPEHLLSNTAAVAGSPSHRYVGSCGTISGMPAVGGRKRTAAGISHRASPIGNYHHSHSHLYRCTGCGAASPDGSLTHQSDGSSPQTDVSYIPSSDGTGRSDKSSRTYDRRSPPKNVLDIVPPPPTDAPPDDAARNGPYEPPIRSNRKPRHSRTHN
ncbi:immunoglobulin I-set domain-containing protein, partial [Aphelenchoides avenae]